MSYGTTSLVPKTEKPSGDPSQYRPITFLPIIYKTFTSIIAGKIYEHLEDENPLDEEQKDNEKIMWL